jgi:hypothetical protein
MAALCGPYVLKGTKRVIVDPLWAAMRKPIGEL